MSKRNRGGNVKHDTQTISRKDVAKIDAKFLNSASPEVKAEQAKVPDAPKQEAAPAKPMIIKVLKKDPKFRGAREAWFNRLVEFDGKPVDDYIESCKTSCPQLTKNNTAENPTGWVGFFKRQGIIAVAAEQAVA